MSLRSYDELAQKAGLGGITSSLSRDSPIGKLIATGMSSATNKAIQRTFGVGIVIFYLILFFGIFPSITNGSEFLIFPLFCLGPFIIGGMVFGGHSLLMSMLMGIPQTLMSKVVLRRGDELLVHYTHPIKRAITLKSMAFTLVLQESATYDQGSSTVTVTHDHVIKQDLDFDVPISPETGIDQQLTFTIPDDAMHTFEAFRNSLHWYVQVKLDIPNFPDYHKNYKVKVLAEGATDES